MTKLPMLKSPRCIMNCISEDDIPVMRQIFDDELTRKYLSEFWTLVETDEGIKQMLSSFNILMKQNEGLIWGVRLNSNLIAFIAFIDLSCNPTVIYAMHPTYRSCGYMKECVALSVQYMLGDGLCSYIQTEVHNDNEISMHLLCSIGFRIINQDNTKTHLKIDTNESN